jgi:hypothetical protein
MDFKEVGCEDVDQAQDRYPVAGFCAHGNESSGSMKGGEFSDQLSEYRFLKKDSAA